MIEVTGADEPLREAVRALAATVEAAGGYGNPKAAIEASDGALRVTATGKAKRGEKLFTVPDACLPVIDGASFAVDGNALTLNRAPAGLGETARTALDQLLAVYNAGGKIAAWRRDYPFAALAADPALADRLLDAVGWAEPLAGQRRALAAGESAETVARSFLMARAYALRDDAARIQGFSAQRVLMPLVDALNHNFFAGEIGYSPPNRDAAGKLVAGLNRPVAGSSECFVRYQVLDPLHSYLHYAFVDTRAPFVLSVPLTLDLPGGVQLELGCELGPGYRGKLPPELAALTDYVPRIDGIRGGRVRVSRLIVPDRTAPHSDRHSFRQILGFVLQGAPGGDDPQQRQALVRSAEAQLLSANASYYRDLQRLAAEARPAAPAGAPPGRDAAVAAVAELAAAQRARLADYAQRQGLALEEA